MDKLHDADKLVWSLCNVNCGSRCPLRLHVKDGVVTRVLSDNTGESGPYGHMKFVHA